MNTHWTHQPVARQLLSRPSILPVWIAVLLLSASSALAQTTLLSETFEGSFPADNGWSVGDANSSGTAAYWEHVNKLVENSLSGSS
jgi:hypothetical protein